MAYVRRKWNSIEWFFAAGEKGLKNVISYTWLAYCYTHLDTNNDVEEFIFVYKNMDREMYCNEEQYSKKIFDY